MSVYKDLTFFKILCHDYKCIIDRTVSMRMVFTHGISDNTGTLPVRLIITDPQLIHIVQSPSLHRLQSIPDIRKCPGDDNTHRIVDIRFFHQFRIFGSDNLRFTVHFHSP